MKTADPLLLDALLGKRIMAALQLHGMNVIDLTIEMRPNTYVRGKIEFDFSAEQLRALLEELTVPPENRR